MYLITHLHGPIEVRETVSVEVSGVKHEIPNHRVLNPGDDISKEPPDLQQACADWWTPARIDAFERSKQDAAARIEEGGDAG
ncbi:hypothetical protein [Sphingobium yanoikuyae]|uniref:hypothetical protein n=1 Tax=Sphingobium yanoikuyae TaxID=13690 RepID=UPI00345E85CA